MKKVILSIAYFYIVGFSINAQVIITPTLPQQKPGVAYDGPWVEIYENQNYIGRKVVITTSSNTVNLGYTPEIISIKIKSGYIAYLSVNCSEFSNEVCFFNNASSYIVPQKSICGIRIEKARDFWVCFNGILSAIHNNDCKKFYGTIKYKIFELNDRNERVYYNLSLAGSGYENVVWAASKNSGRVMPLLYNINDFYVADRDYIDGIVWDPARYKPYIATSGGSGHARTNFKINETAYRNKKVFIEFFTKIGSYHKGCDLCTDFTRDAEMDREEVKVYNLNATAWESIRFNEKMIQVGPFRAPASGPVTFTGGGGIQSGNGIASHTTYLNFTLMD